MEVTSERLCVRLEADKCVCGRVSAAEQLMSSIVRTAPANQTMDLE